MRVDYRAMAAVAILAISASARADGDAPAFDRPGLAFATSTLPGGRCAAEQGMFDASTDRTSGTRSTAYMADSLVHCGIADGIELQLGADSWGHLDVHEPHGVHTIASGGGDARIGVKIAPRSPGAFSFALLATVVLPVGRAPIGGQVRARDLGASIAWAVGDERSLSLYADRHWAADGNGNLVAVGYGFPLHDRLGGYIETGFGTGALHAREAGGGLTWMLTPKVQLDASFLRALDRPTTDWQCGFGVSIAFEAVRS
jgi:hypothetical protein